MSTLALLGVAFITTTKSSLISTAQFGEPFDDPPTAGTSGVIGTVNAYNGYVWYNLDFSNVNWDNLPTNCSNDGLSWHIHTLWSYGYNGRPDDRLDSDSTDSCSSTYTSGHYDPWFACGPASSNPDCKSNGGCIPPSSVFLGSDNYDGNYTCSPADFDLVSYACEVGDYAGKYGRIYLNESMVVEGSFGAFHETNQDTLSPDNNALANDGNGYSMVIHCGSGERIFCAPFLRENLPDTPTVPLDDDQIIETNFNDAGDAFVNFTVKWTNKGIEFFVPPSAKAVCDSWEVWYYTRWAYLNGASRAIVDCDTSQFNGILDLTHSCIPNSGSSYCTDSIRCNGTSNTQSNYSCGAGSSDQDPLEQFWGCAVGDVSSRIGLISSSNNNQLMTDRLSPPLFALGNRAIVMECKDGNKTGNINNICAVTEQTNGTVVTLEPFDTPVPTEAPTPTDVANTLLYGISMIFMCVVAVLIV